VLLDVIDFIVTQCAVAVTGCPDCAGLVCDKATMLRDKMKGTINEKNRLPSISIIYSVLDFVEYCSSSFCLSTVSYSRDTKFGIL
jgi:hypothetical protein